MRHDQLQLGVKSEDLVSGLLRWGRPRGNELRAAARLLHHHHLGRTCHCSVRLPQCRRSSSGKVLTMRSAASSNLIMFDNIDPNGEYAVSALVGHEPAPPAPPAGPAIAPALVAPAPVQANLIRAHIPAMVAQVQEQSFEDVPEDESDEESSDNEEVYADVYAVVQDVQVGQETLVMIPTLLTIMPDRPADAEVRQADVQDVQVALQEIPAVNPTSLVNIASNAHLEAASEEVHLTSDILEHLGSDTSGTETQFTATIGPFAAPTQPTNTVVSPTTPMVIFTGKKLLGSTLEAVTPQTGVRIMEKPDREGVEEPAKKRQAVEKDPVDEARPSDSKNPDNV